MVLIWSRVTFLKQVSYDCQVQVFTDPIFTTKRAKMVYRMKLMHTKDLGADSEDRLWILDSTFKVLGYLSFDDHNPNYCWYYLHQTLINCASYDTYIMNYEEDYARQWA